MDEAGAVGNLAVLVCLGIVRPDFVAGFGVERDYTVVGSAHVEDAIDHERGGFEYARRGFEIGERGLASPPFPCELELADVAASDLGERGVVGFTGVAAILGPVLGEGSNCEYEC